MAIVLERLNFALHHALQTTQQVYLLGEDILDPYGGAFKVTRGLSTNFPTRVLTTPISESAIVGIATGMALRGLRPVVEIMFGDFITLATDQIINHAAKFRWMYNNQVHVPLVIRTPMGGRRGYGPTHSQSLEKMFLGVPGLSVVAPNTLSDPAELLESAIADENPILFIEHKLLYNRSLCEPGKGDMIDCTIERFGDSYPTYTISYLNYAQNPRLTMACYGYNFEFALQTAHYLMMEFEICSEIVLFSQLSPFELSPLYDSLYRTRHLLTVEEGGITLGWGAEIVARVAETDIEGLKIRRVAASDLPIANSRPLEDAILPSQEAINLAALRLVEYMHD